MKERNHLDRKMKLTLDLFRQSARFNWKIGFAMTAYFLFMAFINMLFKSEWPFIILAWPMYVIPKHAGLAAIIEILFVYVIAIFFVMYFERCIEKKEQYLKNASKKESSTNIKK